MRRAALVAVVAGALWGSDGLPARPSPDSYPVKAEAKDLVMAAELMPADQIRSEFSTSLDPRYAVIEVALFPSSGSEVDVMSLDFGLRVDGRLIRPAAPRTIASRNQKRSQDRKKEVVLFPSVGVATGGGYGTGTNVGVGVGVGDAPPGPASTDRDRDVMEAELDDHGLQDGRTGKPVAGYLYFPLGQTKSSSVELIYQQDGGEIKIPLVLPKK